MGIINYQKENNAKIHFFYLFYKNDEFVKQEKSKIYEQLEEELKEIFSVFKIKYKNITSGYMFNNKFDTLSNIENIIT